MKYKVTARSLFNINNCVTEDKNKNMKIVYTPLHGTGEMLARRALAQAGFDSVQVVEAQATPDPDFSTGTASKINLKNSLFFYVT